MFSIALVVEKVGSASSGGRDAARERLAEALAKTRRDAFSGWILA